jgi:hypothetical protein
MFEKRHEVERDDARIAAIAKKIAADGLSRRGDWHYDGGWSSGALRSIGLIHIAGQDTGAAS